MRSRACLRSVARRSGSVVFLRPDTCFPAFLRCGFHHKPGPNKPQEVRSRLPAEGPLSRPFLLHLRPFLLVADPSASALRRLRHVTLLQRGHAHPALFPPAFSISACVFPTWDRSPADASESVAGFQQNGPEPAASSPLSIHFHILF